MESLLQDVKFGIKLLLKDKGFALTSIVTLALCIGANTAIFSVVNAVLLRSLPFDEAERIVLLYNSYPQAGQPRAGASAVGPRSSSAAPRTDHRRVTRPDACPYATRP